MTVSADVRRGDHGPYQHYGFTIQVAPNGRRIWPPKFKQHVAAKIASGDLTVQDVADECLVSKSHIRQWRNEAKSRSVWGRDRPVFAEVVASKTTASQPDQRAISIRGSIVEIQLPLDYPIERLLQLVEKLESIR